MWRRAAEYLERRLRRRRRIFVYEHLTGGGLLDDDWAKLKPLATEGLAMVTAVMDDLSRVPEADAVTLEDARLAIERPAAVRGRYRAVASAAEREARFDAEVRRADGVLLIAPETDGILTRLARRVEELGGRLLSPSSAFCAWAADKSAVAATMLAAGAPMPEGVRLGPSDAWPRSFSTPAVLKPNDGCGSQGVRRLDDLARDARSGTATVWRLERFVPGEAASVLVLLGPTTRAVLCGFTQTLSDDGTLQYLGGSGPLAPNLQQRLERLVDQVFEPLPDWQGFIGLDVVLGPAEDGSADYLIEVNPRLTTSYAAARTMYRTNLMQLLLDVLDGRPAELAARIGTLRFDKEGAVDGCWVDQRSPATL